MPAPGHQLGCSKMWLCELARPSEMACATASPRRRCLPQAGAEGNGTSFLIVHTGATAEVKQAADNGYTLTMTSVPADAILFSDRPARSAFLLPVDEVWRGLNASAADPVNAALTFRTGDSELGRGAQMGAVGKGQRCCACAASACCPLPHHRRRLCVLLPTTLLQWKAPCWWRSLLPSTALKRAPPPLPWRRCRWSTPPARRCPSTPRRT